MQPLAFRYTILMMIVLLSAYTAMAQRRDEIWPEINAFYRFNDKFRLYGLASGTQQDSSGFADGSMALHLDYFTLPYFKRNKGMDTVRGYYLWLRAGYAYGSSASGADNPYREHMIITEANSLFYMPWNIQAALKNRVDWRIYNNDFSPRYRPRLMFARDFRTMYLTFNSYVYGEYFVNFDDALHNRFRLCLGTELRVSRIFNFEAYIMRQFDNGLKSSALSAVGLVLKMYLKHHDKKVTVDEKDPSAVNQ
jgi:hypothetical protein